MAAAATNGSDVTTAVSSSRASETITNSSAITEEKSAIEKAPPLVMTIVNGTKAVYFNLSLLPCQAQLKEVDDCKQNFSYSSATYDAEDGLVHQAVLLNRHSVLGVIFYHGQEGAPDQPEFPKDIEFTIHGANTASSMSIKVKFRVRIVAEDVEKSKLEELAGLPHGLLPIDGRCTACPEVAELEDFVYAHGSPVRKSAILEPPFLSRSHPLENLLTEKSRSFFAQSKATVDSGAGGNVGAVVQMSFNPHILTRVPYQDLATAAEKAVAVGDEFMGNMFVRQSLTSQGMPPLVSVLPLCRVLGFSADDQEYSADRGRGRFSPLYPASSKSEADCYQTKLVDFLNSTQNMNSMRRIKPKPKFPNVLFNVDESARLDDELSEKDVENAMLLLVYLPATSPDEGNNTDLINQTSPVIREHRWFQVRIEIFRIHDAMTTKGDKVLKVDGGLLSATVQQSLSLNSPKEVSSRGTSSEIFPGARFACILSNIKWKYPATSPPSNSTEDTHSGDDKHRVSRRLTALDSSRKIKPTRSVIIVFDGAEEKTKVTSPSMPLHSKSSSLRDKSAFSPRAKSHRRVLDKPSRDQKPPSMHDVIQSFTAANIDAPSSVAHTADDENKYNIAGAGDASSVFSVALDVLHGITQAIYKAIGRPMSDPSEAHRKLTTDTYGQSLIHVNRLYQKAFGFENRKVPAHLPHMIDKSIMSEMQDMFADEWASTSSHKFRSTKDMQYAFSYYYYVMNRNKAKPPSLMEYVSREIDTNRDGFLNKNEFLTLAAQASGRSPRESDIENYYDCVFRRGEYSNLTDTYNETGTRPLDSYVVDSAAMGVKSEEDMLIRKKVGVRAMRKIERVVNERRAREKMVSDHEHGERASSTNVISSADEIAGGEYEQKTTIHPFPSVEEVLGCPLIVTELKDRISWPVTYAKGTDSDVAFEMIGDNFTNSFHQLNSIRARRPKFICINDNMQEPPAELMTAFEEFFEAMYPFQSQFELPAGQSNPSLYTDELKAFYDSKFNMVYTLVYSPVSLVSSSLFYARALAVFVLETLLALLDGNESSSGIYVLWRRAALAPDRKVTTQNIRSSSSHLAGLVTAHDLGYDFTSSGSVVHTVSMTLPLSFLILNIGVVILIVWISREIRNRRRQRAATSSGIHHEAEVAKLDGVTTPKLAVAASVEKPLSTSSFSFASRRFSRPAHDEDFLNKLWRKAGYSGGEEAGDKDVDDNEDTLVASPGEGEAWEDREVFLGGRSEGRKKLIT